MLKHQLRYKRLGLDHRWLDVIRANANTWLKWEVGGISPPSEVGHNIHGNLYAMSTSAIVYYLRGDVSEAHQWARRLLDETARYFFGDWRVAVPNNPLRPEDDGYWANGGGDWLDAIRDCFAFGSALGEWEILRRLARFPNDGSVDCGTNAGLKPWYLALCAFLRGEPAEVLAERVATIGRGGSAGQKKAAAVLEAIANRDMRILPAAFDTYMNYYDRSIRPRQEIDCKLALDGTTFVHLARHQGLAFEFNRKWHDVLMSPGGLNAARGGRVKTGH